MINFDTVSDWVFIGLLLVGITPLLHFIYRYHRYSPWRSTPIGRTLMYQKLAMAGILLLALFARLFGDYTLRPYLTLIVYGALVFFFWRTDVQLLHTQRDFPGPDNWKAFWSKRKR